MASIKLTTRLKLLSPFVDEKVFRNLQKRLEGVSVPQKTTKVLDHLKGTSELTEEKSVQAVKHTNGKYLQENKEKIKVNYDQWYQKDAAELKVEPIYKTLPNARVALNGTTPEPRFIWKEKNWPNGFPNSPKEANTDVMTYLEQKDCYQRLQKLNVKDFCVGSIVSVTRSDPYVPKGNVKFVGICIGKNHWQNTLGATFTLRNVVEGEPVEVNFQLYSPLIQKIEVLKHERRHRKALWYLRDYPPSFSSIDEKMKARPYREEPSLYIPSKQEKQKIKKWFTEVWKQKRR